MPVEAIPVRIPLLNPNEPEALLAALHVQEGQSVAPGDLLCTLETTKSTAELTAEAAGMSPGSRSLAGQTARAGELLCYLAPSPDWQPPDVSAQPAQAKRLPENLRITQPALALARQHNLDLSRLPSRNADHREAGAGAAWGGCPPRRSSCRRRLSSANAIVIYGGGGHGKALIDLLRALGELPHRRDDR